MEARDQKDVIITWLEDFKPLNPKRVQHIQEYINDLFDDWSNTGGETIRLENNISDLESRLGKALDDFSDLVKERDRLKEALEKAKDEIYRQEGTLCRYAGMDLESQADSAIRKTEWITKTLQSLKK